ncbi:hypothetical protein Scep_024345 [Stephania cephalantha]|uniref:Putative plant transposon protein domain-containing protein n=1 Tax=Stephania cephalantha TaxID=152367 RepID=A0AAP0EWD8_9MAGN
MSTNAGVLTQGDVDFTFFDKAHLPIREILAKMGWVQFCEYKAKFYPQLVRTFYPNMKTSNDYMIKSRIGRRQVVITSQLLSEKLGLPLLEPTVTLGEKVQTWPFDKLVVLNSFRRGNTLLIYPRGPSDTEFKIVSHLLHRIVHRVIVPRKGSKNYVTVLDMYILGALMTDEKISLPYLIIAHMMTYARTGRHLPYGHILARFFEEAGGVRYGGYEDPHPSNPDEPFDAHEYLDYSFTCLQGDANEDQGVAPGNEEVHQEIPTPQAPQPTPQPFSHAYIPQTYYGMALPPYMPPYAIYLSA